MRTENEVLAQLLDFANNDPKVRAVLLNGSRVNPNIKKDLFCDYDVVFSVTEPEYYLHNQAWTERFGELVIMQQNEVLVDGEDAYIFLMQFQDGVRIDLSFHPLDCIHKSVGLDSLTKVLLDKDQLIGTPAPADESSHFVGRPTEKEFAKALNEAWWIQTYVAKGLWRDELPYVKHMFDVILIDCLVRLLTWYVGLEHNWQINTGKCGKRLKSYLPDNVYREFIKVYPGIDDDGIWEALFAYGKLVRKIGNEVAKGLGYTYPTQDDINVTKYLQKVMRLPKNADDFE
jgi:aminoglycoside 6-adenylyltransferase